MKPKIIKLNRADEFYIDEGCYINEYENSPDPEGLSLAQARVKPGVRTRRHRLKGCSERYLILQGQGRVEVGDLEPTEVGPGDLVIIPADVDQRIENIGEHDLVFVCLCRPGFKADCYIDSEQG